MVPALSGRVDRTDVKMPAGRQSFADVFDPKNNAFGFLRLTLAVLVVFSHCYPLGDFGREPLKELTQGRLTIGLVAVAMFFVLSGFLICRSACGTISVGRFLWHRFLRVFPGYWICLIASAFVFAPLVALQEHGTMARLFSASDDSPLQYVLGNAALFHFSEFSLEGILNVNPRTIGGLLSGNPHPCMINGSLWTLPIEVGCYLAVAVLAVLGVFRHVRCGIIGLFVSLYALYACSYLSPETFREAFPFPALPSVLMLSLYFSAGCLCFLYRESIPCSTPLFAASVLLLVASLPLSVFAIVAPVAMTYSFLWLAFYLPFSRFDARGDFSYGTYIYAFPVQQGLAMFGIHEEGFSIYFASSLLLTFVFAIVSYRIVEAPCLRLKNYHPRLFGLVTQRPAIQADNPAVIIAVNS